MSFALIVYSFVLEICLLTSSWLKINLNGNLGFLGYSGWAKVI